MDVQRQKHILASFFFEQVLLIREEIWAEESNSVLRRLCMFQVSQSPKQKEKEGERKRSREAEEQARTMYKSPAQNPLGSHTVHGFFLWFLLNKCHWEIRLFVQRGLCVIISIPLVLRIFPSPRHYFYSSVTFHPYHWSSVLTAFFLNSFFLFLFIFHAK